MSEPRLILIDFSSIAFPIWSTAHSDPNPDTPSIQMVGSVRRYAQGEPHVAVCCDHPGPTFRHKIDAAYKAQRPEKPAPFIDQMKKALETLKADGFPIWRVEGYEADDIIATAVRIANERGLSVGVVTADKDILQLVSPTVVAISTRSDGVTMGPQEVADKFRVTPEQMRDYLTLVGDKSDNVTGAQGIGEKTAGVLLAQFGTLDALYAQLDEKGAGAIGLSLAVSKSLKEFQPRMATVRSLIQMATDVPIAFDEILKRREPIEMPDTDFTPVAAVADETPERSPFLGYTPAQAGLAQVMVEHERATAARQSEAPTKALTVQPPVVLDFESGLEPRNLAEAKALATDMFRAGMFSGYGNPQAVLSTVMVGRELGMKAMASLRSIHIIEGKHALSAAAMVALVLKSRVSEYFLFVSGDDKQATFRTKRKGALEEEILWQYTLQMATQAKLVKPNGNWDKNPRAMCIARCQAELCRLKYSDILLGMYTPEELEELRDVA